MLFKLLFPSDLIIWFVILLIGSPVTRWASIAFGAGLGIGSAYTDCSRAFDAPAYPSSSAPILAAPKVTEPSVSQVSRNYFCQIAFFFWYVMLLF